MSNDIDAELAARLAGRLDSDAEKAITAALRMYAVDDANPERRNVLRDLIRADRERSAKHDERPMLIDRYEISALHSTRAAMRDAGVQGWEMGSGVSSADAIRMIAAERDAALARTTKCESRRSFDAALLDQRIMLLENEEENEARLDQAIAERDAARRAHIEGSFVAINPTTRSDMSLNRWAEQLYPGCGLRFDDDDASAVAE